MHKISKLEFWPIFITIFIVATSISLGFWQIHRLNIKTALLDQIHIRTHAEPLEFNNVVAPEEMQYRRYNIRGKFLHSKSMLLFSSDPIRGMNNGYYIMIPFATENGVNLLVNAGWISSNGSDEYIVPKDPDQISTITAIAMTAKHQYSYGMLKNNAKRHMWFSVNLNEMSDICGEILNHEIYMIMIDGDKSDSMGLTKYPIDKFVRDIKNNHLIYAITWFSLGIAMACIYFIYRRDVTK